MFQARTCLCEAPSSCGDSPSKEIADIVSNRASPRKMHRKQWWQLALPGREDVTKRESKDRETQSNRGRPTPSKRASMLAMIARESAISDRRLAEPDIGRFPAGAHMRPAGYF